MASMPSSATSVSEAVAAARAKAKAKAQLLASDRDGGDRHAKDKEHDEEREEQGDEDLLSYSEYRPAKLKYGVRHPDPVVENSSLAAVPPPDITCEFLVLYFE